MTIAERVQRVEKALFSKTPALKWALALVCGALTALALPPFGFWLIALLGLAASFGLLRVSKTVRQAGLIGWGFGTGYFAISLHWIVEPFAVDAARHLWMAPFALLFLATGLALFWGAAFALAYRVSHDQSVWAGAISWALFLCAADFLRSYVLTGFPWAMISQMWVQTGVIQWISLIGPHGLTLLTLIAIALPCAAIGSGVARLVPAFSPAALLVLGGLFWAPTEPQPPANGPVVRLIQPNAPQHEKWHPDLIPVFFQRQIDFTGAPSKSGARPDLIVWPETAVPALLEYADGALERIADAAQGSPVVFGIQRRDGLRLYNSMVSLNAQGDVAGIYDKHHLVPFGEYIPFGSFLGRFGLRGLAAKDGKGYSAGPGPTLLDLGTLGRALPLICYEAVFPQGINRAPERPDFLLQITNDAWFGQFSGPYQHLAQARMRAIEQGMPMVRAANTGVSAMIDPRGVITAQLALGKAGFIDAVLPAKLPPTLYSRSGDLPVALLLLAGLLTVALTARRNRAPK